MSDTPPPTETVKPTPPPARRPGKTSILKALAAHKGQAAVAAIAILAISNVATWVKLTREQQPMIVTVGVREMSQGYVSQLALSNITPEEAAVKTELFLAATQDTVKRAAANKNVLLLARECVLAGEAADITKEVGEAVKLAMSSAGAGSLPTGKSSVAPLGVAP